MLAARTYALNAVGQANVDRAIQNLDAIEQRTREKPISVTIPISVKQRDKTNKDVKIDVTLADILKLIRKNNEAHRILAVPDLKKGKKLLEGDGKGGPGGQASPHAYACLRGTIVRDTTAPANDPNHQRRGCPEGTILIDASLFQDHAFVLTTPTGYKEKAILASLLVHEKMHEYLLAKATDAAVQAGWGVLTENWNAARAQVIDEKTHAKVYDFQAAVVEEEKNSFKTTPLDSKFQPQDRENGITGFEQFINSLRGGTGFQIGRSPGTGWAARAQGSVCGPRSQTPPQAPPVRPWVPPPSPPPSVSMSGSYVGLEFSVPHGSLDTRETLASTDQFTNGFQDSSTAAAVGFVVGYNFMPWSNGIVVGPFASFDGLRQTINHNFAGGQFLGTTTYWIATLGGRFGYAVHPGTLVYGLAGASFLNQDLNVNFATPASRNTTTAGFTLGLGGEYRPTGWTVGGMPLSVFAQYQHTWYDSATFNTPASSPAFNYAFKRDDDIVKLGINLYPWSPPPPEPTSGFPVKAPRLK